MNSKNQFFILLRQQLMMSFSALRHGGRQKTEIKKEKKGAGKVMGTAVLMLVLAGFAVYLETKVMDAAIAIGMPDLLLRIVAFAAMMLSLFYCIVQGNQALYFNKEVELYAPLPIRDRPLYLAQLGKIWVSECGVTALLVLPMALIYSRKLGWDAGLLLRCLLLILAIPLVPVAIGALIGGLMASMPAFKRHQEGFSTGLSIVMMVVSIVCNYLLGQLSGRVAADEGAMTGMLSGRTDMLGRVFSAFPPARWAGEALMGNWGSLALLFVCGICAVALVCLIFGGRYIESASQGQEAGTRRAGKAGKRDYTQVPVQAALLRREWQAIIRTPQYLLNCGVGAFLVPILMTGGMLMGFSNAGESLREVLHSIFDQRDLSVLALCVAGILSLMGGMNTACATSVSREGKCHGLMVGMPVDVKKILRAKVMSGFILAVMGLILPVAVLIILLPEYTVWFLLGLLWSVMLNDLFSHLAVLLDTLKPKLTWTTEVQAVKQNLSQIWGMLAGFGVMGFLAFLTVMIVNRGIGGLPWILTAAVVLMCIGSRVLLYRAGVKAYLNCEG